ncbi:MAG: hypothetical protein KTR26_20725 [Flammeovirgaceae bacterium]|nr:hypothetical protein [Flammeovirgaceae bacterium]
MLEYSKTILEKVSFDLKLFERELVKAIDHLIGEEVKDLRIWCETNFSGHYQELSYHFVKAN